jgi:hypothetical protein
MIRKSDYIEQIDKYLNKELGQPELSNFEVQIDYDSDLAEELNMIKEIDLAVAETDVLALRKNLNKIIQKNADPEDICVLESFNFGLSDEFSSLRKMDNQLELEKIINTGHSFPKIHLYQHRIAGKETIHHFYKEQHETESEINQMEFSEADEELFSDIHLALDENDILDIRANLKQIAQSIPEHQYSSQDFEDYIYGYMDSEQRKLFENNLVSNPNLKQDVLLFKEIDLAWLENEVMDLRTSLSEIQKSKINYSEKLELIDRYIYQDLSADEMASFQAELDANSNLVNEINLIKNIDLALFESDIMLLRNNLQSISEKVISEKKVEQSFIAKFKKNRILISAVAASLIIFLGITSLLPGKNSHNELYQKFYTTYQTSGISRSFDLATDQTLTAALQKFDNKEYDTAIVLLQKVIDLDQNNMVGHFYSGMALQETKKYQAAIGQYQAVIDDKNSLFVQQAKWYIGLCYLQTNENKKAYKILKSLTDKNSFYYSNAQVILQKINYLD